MAAYVVVQVHVNNPEPYEVYKKGVAATLTSFGGRFLVRGGKVETVEGDWKPERFVILEFPSVERAREWWNSPEYQAVASIRWANASSQMIFVEGGRLKRVKVKEPDPPVKKTIGILAERSLHAALKKWYAREGDQTEVPLEGYHIDLVRGDLLIEIQTRNFYALKRKLPKLLETHRLRLVHPIAVDKWLVRVAADGVTELSRRRSPKHGTFEDIFDELVHVPTLLGHPNFSLDILLICQEEIRRVRKVREKPAKRTRFYRDWDRHDHRLAQVLDSRLIESLDDLRAFLPPNLPPQFTNREMAHALGNNYPRAQSMTYVMRQIGILKIAGKRGRSILYEIL